MPGGKIKATGCD